MLEIQCGFVHLDSPAAPAYLARYGPTAFVKIGFDVAFRPESGTSPDLPDQEYPALIGTGASESCIDSELAAILELPIVDRIKVAGVGGTEELNLHAAQISIPDMALNLYGRFAGVHLVAGGQNHRALLGRSFLLHCDMTYNGAAGSVTIRGPSIPAPVK